MATGRTNGKSRHYQGDTDQIDGWAAEGLTSFALDELDADFDRDPEGWKPYMSHAWLRTW